jgi:ubiquinone/menaquinone biosynthesis C-methylase UbiE
MISPTPHQKENVAETWDKISLNYNREAYWKGHENHANLKVLLKHIGEPAGKKILEVGCGSGFTSAAFAKMGANCALLDISSESLNVAVGAFLSEGLPAPETYNEDALSSRVPSDAFDVVWNGGVIEHFYDDGKKIMIKEMLRMTKVGGTVIILVPNSWCVPFQILQVWQKWRGTWPYGFEDDMSPRRLGRLCRDIGLNKPITYAFNPVLGWRYVPFLGDRIVKLLGVDTIEAHSKKSKMGFVSALVINK